MFPPINANGPQRQNGEIQVDKSQKYYNVKISVKLPVISVIMIGEQLNQVFFFLKEAK